MERKSFFLLCIQSGHLSFRSMEGITLCSPWEESRVTSHADMWTACISQVPKNLCLLPTTTARAGHSAEAPRMQGSTPRLSPGTQENVHIPHLGRKHRRDAGLVVPLATQLPAPRPGGLPPGHTLSPMRNKALKDLDSKQSWCAESSCPKLLLGPQSLTCLWV